MSFVQMITRWHNMSIVLAVAFAVVTIPQQPAPIKAVKPAALVQQSAQVNTVAQVVLGNAHTCALTTSGHIKCWGDNSYGQLGNGNSIESNIPVDVTGLISGTNAISAGLFHTCALTDGNGIKCWGANFYGQLGNGNTIHSSTSVNVVGLSSDVSGVSAGNQHTCALTSSGGVKCWGWNTYGQLGNGSNTLSSVPVDVIGLSSGVNAISTGGYHTCALIGSGGIKCWGANFNGQMGNGNTAHSSVPVDVVGLGSGISAVSAGGNHTCTLTGSGGIKCWGSNFYGQLGNGSTVISFNTSIDVVGLGSGISAVSAGGYHTCALIGSGGIKCWGSNFYGQLGNDNITNSFNTAVDVIGLNSSTSDVSTGSDHTCTLTNSGGVKCWGWNAFGQLGNSSTTDSRLPVDVIGLSSSTPTPTATATPTPLTPTATTPAPTTSTPTPTPTPTTLPTEPAGIAVLVHGWQGLSLVTGTSFTCDEGTPLPGIANIHDDFGNIKTLLEQNNWRVYFAHYETRTGYTAPIDVSAACLSNRIDAIVRKENGRKVTIIAHSMGGLVARQYVDKPVVASSESNWQKVERLITLGSPHWGINLGIIRHLSTLASLLKPGVPPISILACKVDPGTCELALDSMTTRNFFNQPQPVGDYHFIGGSGANISGTLQPGLQAILLPTEGTNDGFVGQRSAIGYAPVVNVSLGSPNRYKTNATHVQQWGEDQSYFDAIETECTLSDIMNLTKYRICPSAPAINTPEQPDSTSDASYTTLPTIADTLQPGMSRIYDIAVDGGEMTLLLAWNEGDLELQLTAPSGLMYTKDSIASDIPGAVASSSITTDSLSSISYIIPAPQTGIWQATIRSTNNSISSPFVLLGALQSTINLTVDSITPIVGGNDAKFIAHLSDAGRSLTSATITATVATTAGQFTITLREESPGTYVASSVVTGEPGQYMVNFEAAGVTPLAFRREGTGLLEIFAPSAEVTATATWAALNTDNIVGLDLLRLTVPVGLPDTNRYAITILVNDSLGTPVTTTQHLVNSSTGPVTLTVNIPASLIRQRGVAGPYQADIQIVSADDMSTVFVQSRLAQSAVFKISDFAAERHVYLPLIRRP